MQHNFWRYIDQENQLSLNHISNLFDQEKVTREGEFDQGRLKFHTIKSSDKFFGSDATLEISWEKVDPVKYHHGLKVKQTISMFSAIQVVINKKETKWSHSHELTLWYGSRNQILKKRFFSSKITHGIMFCELTSRIFEMHGIFLGQKRKLYEQAIMDAIDSFYCHES